MSESTYNKESVVLYCILFTVIGLIFGFFMISGMDMRTAERVYCYGKNGTVLFPINDIFCKYTDGCKLNISKAITCREGYSDASIWRSLG